MHQKRSKTVFHTQNGYVGNLKESPEKKKKKKRKKEKEKRKKKPPRTSKFSKVHNIKFSCIYIY